MCHFVSNLADYVSGERVVSMEKTKARMRDVLKDIQTGQFTLNWMSESLTSQPFLKAKRRNDSNLLMIKEGERLCSMMP